MKNASVLIVGAGGLGCPAAMYLTSAGVGKVFLLFNIILFFKAVTNFNNNSLHYHKYGLLQCIYML